VDALFSLPIQAHPGRSTHPSVCPSHILSSLHRAYHTPLHRPIAHTNPPPPTGKRSTQTPRSHTTLLHLRFFCSARSFLTSSSSVAASGARSGSCAAAADEESWALCEYVKERQFCGRRIERGFLKVWRVMWRRARMRTFSKFW
jgi:hypothetical protein